jgi:hypothetical protein
VKIENTQEKKMDKTIKKKADTAIMKQEKAHLCDSTWLNGGLSNFDGVASYFFLKKDIK